MMTQRKHIFIVLAAVVLSAGITTYALDDVIVSTEAYTWRGDTVFQNEFYATAPSRDEIVSTYAAQPGFFMPVEKTWKRKNDLTAYPRLTSSNRLHDAVYTMALDEMVNNVEADTTLRTGKEWAGVWTRDVSYSIILSMAALQPEASRISLMRKVNSDGQIIQDTGSGGAWPISTDRMIWAAAAYELYKVTGDHDWLKYMYDVVKRSLEKDTTTVMSDSGLVRGETSFIDWREQSYPKWMQTADIYRSESLSTAVVHAAAMDILAKAAAELGHDDEAQSWAIRSKELREAINREFWLDDRGHYGMYRYGRDFTIMNPRSETVGQSLAILYDVADPERAATITGKSPVTKWGAPIFFPQIADMPAYHNNALWPWVAAAWTLANAKVGNEQGVLQGFGSIVRPAALFATNKENLNLDNGDIATELNSSNMLWSLAGNIGITQQILFGIHFEEKGIRFAPFVPRALADTRRLEGLHYRDAIVNITVSGYGNEIKEFYINGKRTTRHYLPGNAKGVQDIRIIMADNDIAPMSVNMAANVKAPLTPIVRWAVTPTAPFTVLEWNPIEYIASYDIVRDGRVIDNVTTTTYDASTPGEYMVIGVADDGTRGFASEPLSNRPVTVLVPEDRTATITSTEVAYQPRNALTGSSDGRFVEIDQLSDPVAVTFDAPEDGIYSVRVRYANGNGPVNTENKAAIRSLKVDNQLAGTIVMPQRGVANWNDWGMSATVTVPLSKGSHTLSIVMRSEDRNMNLHTNHALIDNIQITRIK